MNARLAFVSVWPENIVQARSPVITFRPDEWYKTIPDKFWKWT
jgi:hypothetical protein